MDDQKPSELVEKLLNEDPGDEKLDPVYVQRRDAARADAARTDPPVSVSSSGNEMDGEDDEDEDPEDDRNEVDFQGEAGFAAHLGELIEDNIPGARVTSFQDAGVLTRNEGLIVRTPNGKFQVTVVEDRRGY